MWINIKKKKKPALEISLNIRDTGEGRLQKDSYLANISRK